MKRIIIQFIILLPLYCFSQVQCYVLENQFNTPFYFESNRFKEAYGNTFENGETNYNVKHPYSRLASGIRDLDKRDFKAIIKFIFNDMFNVWQKTKRKYNNGPSQKLGEFASIRIDCDAEESIKLEFVTGNENRAIAYAHSPLQGDTRIIINIDKWEKLNNYQRIWLFTHELGHEYFGLEHGSSKLMYPLMPEQELLLDYYLLMSPENKTLMNMNLDDANALKKKAKFSGWHKEGKNYLNLGNGVKKENLGTNDFSISYAFATLWVAMDEFFSEIMVHVDDLLLYETNSINYVKPNKFNYLVRVTKIDGELFFIVKF